jgi:hypothetical protein
MEEFDGGGLDKPTGKLFEEIKKTFDSELIKKKYDPDLLKGKIKNSLERVQVPELSIDQKRDLFKALMEFYKSTDTNISSSKPSSKPVTKQGKNERWMPPGTASSSTQSESILTEKDIFKVLYENSSLVTPEYKDNIFKDNAKYRKFASEIDQQPEVAAEKQKAKEAEEKEKEAEEKEKEEAEKTAAEKAAAEKTAAEKAAAEKAAAEKAAAEKAAAEKAAAEKAAKEETRQEEERKAKEAAENTRPIIGHFELNKGTAVFIEDNPQPQSQLSPEQTPTKPAIYSFHKKYYYTKSIPNEFYEYTQK